MSQLLIQYTYLQVLDFLTTVAFLIHGVREANPFVRVFMEVAPSPLVGLALVKLTALILALYCAWTRKERLLSRINWLFALVVAWNLVALILGSVHWTG